MKTFRFFHRILGFFLFIFLIVAAITGLLRANAKFWYWKDPSSPNLLLPLNHPQLSIVEAMNIFQRRFPQEEINTVELKMVMNKLVYQIASKKHAKSKILVDTSSAEVLSPIAQDVVVAIAQSYVGQGIKILSIEKLSSYKARKNQESRPVFVVRFSDDQKTEIFIDRDTAEVLNVLNEGRRFGVWVNKFHELDFFGLSRWALTILGALVVILSILGLLLGLMSRRRK